jgi:hypothetical protein
MITVITLLSHSWIVPSSQHKPNSTFYTINSGRGSFDHVSMLILVSTFGVCEMPFVIAVNRRRVRSLHVDTILNCQNARQAPNKFQCISSNIRGASINH